MSKAFPSPEPRAQRHKLYVLVGYAAVIAAILMIATIRGLWMDGTALALLTFATSRAIFGVVDRLPRWNRDPPLDTPSTLPMSAAAKVGTSSEPRESPVIECRLHDRTQGALGERGGSVVAGEREGMRRLASTACWRRQVLRHAARHALVVALDMVPGRGRPE